MMFSLAKFIERVFLKNATIGVFINTAIIVLITIIVRSIFTILANRMSFQSSKTVKKKLRTMIYDKLLKIGLSYKEKIKTSEVVQVAVEGVEQLETYFGAYLPQFFYAMIAPITLFIVISFINVVVAGILLICVPLIPISIAMVQTWAKKLLSKYWGQYTSLGDTFLENLQGLTTLKIYQSDEFKNNEMNIEAEKFRKITMKVLIMQLNSIAIMDLVAYGGAALGMIVSVYYYLNGQINLFGCVFIILLSVDFFIPMRQLGSFFHIAMNGMAASDKIFKIIDLKENNLSIDQFPISNYNIKLDQLSFSYEENNDVLSNIDFLKYSEASCCGVIYGNGISLYRKKRLLRSGTLPFFKNNKIFKNMGFCHQDVFIKSSLAKSMRFRENFKLCADYDMLWRLYKKGYRIVHIDLLISITDLTDSISARNIIQQVHEEAVICQCQTNTIYFRFLLLGKLIKSYLKHCFF